MPKPLKFSRRSLLRNFCIGAAVTALSVAPVRSSFGQGKIPKMQAKYQDSPNGDRQCSGCTNFVPPSSCQIVESEVSPRGWCQFFARKSNATAAGSQRPADFALRHVEINRRPETQIRAGPTFDFSLR